MTKDTTAKVMIDGTEYAVPRMKFKTLKRAYPLFQKVQNSEDMLEMAEATIEVISMAMAKEHPDMTSEWIEENLDADETLGLVQTFTQMMVDAGLITKDKATELLDSPGEDGGAAPSTATSTPSSQSLSRRAVKAAAGPGSKKTGT